MVGLFIFEEKHTFSSSPQPLPSSRDWLHNSTEVFLLLLFSLESSFPFILRQTWYPLIFRLFWIIHTIDFYGVALCSLCWELKKLIRNSALVTFTIWWMAQSYFYFTFMKYLIDWLVHSCKILWTPTTGKTHWETLSRCAQRTVQWWINTVFLPHSCPFFLLSFHKTWGSWYYSDFPACLSLSPVMDPFSFFYILSQDFSAGVPQSTKPWWPKASVNVTSPLCTSNGLVRCRPWDGENTPLTIVCVLWFIWGTPVEKGCSKHQGALKFSPWLFSHLLSTLAA